MELDRSILNGNKTLHELEAQIEEGKERLAALKANLPKEPQTPTDQDESKSPVPIVTQHIITS